MTARHKYRSRMWPPGILLFSNYKALRYPLSPFQDLKRPKKKLGVLWELQKAFPSDWSYILCSWRSLHSVRSLQWKKPRLRTLKKHKRRLLSKPFKPLTPKILFFCLLEKPLMDIFLQGTRHHVDEIVQSCVSLMLSLTHKWIIYIGTQRWQKTPLNPWTLSTKKIEGKWKRKLKWSLTPYHQK